MPTIALSNSGKRVRVSDCDFAAVCCHTWYLKRSRDQEYPATGIRTGDKVKTIRLHRFIAERAGILENPSDEVHHIDGNRFNCERENLQALDSITHGRVTRGVYDDVPF